MVTRLLLEEFGLAFKFKDVAFRPLWSCRFRLDSLNKFLDIGFQILDASRVCADPWVPEPNLMMAHMGLGGPSTGQPPSR